MNQYGGEVHSLDTITTFTVQPFEINPKIIHLLRMGQILAALIWATQIQVLGGVNKTTTHTFCNLIFNTASIK
jgi:hypothetical protein